MGSTAKLALAPLLATRFDTSDLLCQKYLAGRKNHDGNRGFRDCSAPGAQIPMYEAYMDSNNLLMAEAMKQFSIEQIFTAVAAAGLNMPKDDVAPRVAVAFGHIPASVRSQLRMVAAISRGARHERPEAVLPTMIRSMSLLQKDGTIQTLSFESGCGLWASARSRTYRFVALVLKPPRRRLRLRDSRSPHESGRDSCRFA